jgi:hypothetical protein
LGLRERRLKRSSIKIGSFRHRMRPSRTVATTPACSSASPAAILGVLLTLVPLIIFSWAPAMRSHPSCLDVVLAIDELFRITAAVSGAAIGGIAERALRRAAQSVRGMKRTAWNLAGARRKGCRIVERTAAGVRIDGGDRGFASRQVSATSPGRCWLRRPSPATVGHSRGESEPGSVSGGDAEGVDAVD